MQENLEHMVLDHKFWKCSFHLIWSFFLFSRAAITITVLFASNLMVDFLFIRVFIV